MAKKEKYVNIGALFKLLADNAPKAMAIAEAKANAIEGLTRVLLLENNLLVLKEGATKVCHILFGNS